MAIREGIELIELYGMQETRPDPNKLNTQWQSTIIKDINC